MAGPPSGRAPAWPCRAGGLAVAAGPFIFGAIGDETRLEYTVLGNTVNTAAKLEKHKGRTRGRVDQARGLRPGRTPGLRRARYARGTGVTDGGRPARPRRPGGPGRLNPPRRRQGPRS
ncbi:MAG: hypothetical protein FJX36_09825 [Alphaproteobacteria bacterium]|nr:hypothetical protein [Alphaproteobacteria bacterium]